MISELQRDGISVLPDGFDGVSSFVKYLSNCPVYPNHVRQGRDEAPLGSLPWMCHDIHDVIRAPGWFEKAVSLLPVAAEYLGTRAYLYSLNAFYTDPAPFTKRDIQEFHRDSDDSKFVVLFLYCTDVLTKADGAHQFMEGSQHPSGCHYSEGLGIKTVLGTAGTLFFAATRGLHRGMIPKNKRRMVAWARYGVSDPPDAYVWDKLSPLPKTLLGDRYPSDPELQEAVRLVVT